MACPGHGVSHRDPVSLSAGLSLPWGGTDLLGKLSPGRGDVEPVAQVDDMALEKQGGRISCW